MKVMAVVRLDFGMTIPDPTDTPNFGFVLFTAGVNSGATKATSTWPRTDTTTVALLQQPATHWFKKNLQQGFQKALSQSLQ